MHAQRLARVLIVGSVTALTVIVACGPDDGRGGGGGGGGSTPDAKIYMDAPASTPDAPGSGSSATGLGQSCTPPASGSGQGDCPAGYVCLNLQGGTHPWCSKPCTQGAGDMCAMGYTGPGAAGCFEQISFNNGPQMLFCGITCSGDVNGCTATTCNGTCPSGLACSASLMDGSGNTLGSACQ